MIRSYGPCNSVPCFLHPCSSSKFLKHFCVWFQEVLSIRGEVFLGSFIFKHKFSRFLLADSELLINSISNRYVVIVAYLSKQERSAKDERYGDACANEFV